MVMKTLKFIWNARVSPWRGLRQDANLRPLSLALTEKKDRKDTQPQRTHTNGQF